ncbi:hypothetical protein [Bradyrhizobium sp. SZCCHNS1054]|uniref:hypothetical protein n=1 Tax=Bradyrhizobium sp. SZCCHNS1054 TaxID=3057301 RepID=UPI002915E7CE|nr:hypothetical protein [Bradyrhizobium sp. SZCCHNS1054]
MNSPTPDSTGSARDDVKLIEVVRTPLAFLVLGFLIVDSTVATLAMTLTDYRTVLVATVILSIPIFIFTVVALAVWRPEALRGDRPLQAVYANQFAADLFLALDGPMKNLKTAERTEAWLTFADVITSDPKADSTYQTFCATVAGKITKLANLGKPRSDTLGRIS